MPKESSLENTNWHSALQYAVSERLRLLPTSIHQNIRKRVHIPNTKREISAFSYVRFLTVNDSPLTLQSDSAKVMERKIMKKILRNEISQQALADPKCQNQNRAERMVQSEKLNMQINGEASLPAPTLLLLPRNGA